MGEAPARDVLIVEDDLGTAELERRTLARAGINVQLATTVSEAKALLKTSNFQAVLLDYQLPDGDAWDVVELARSLVPPVPVVLVTAMGSERVVAEAIQHGVVEYVRKSDRFLDQLPDTVNRVARIAQYEANLRRSDTLLQLIADHATDVILTLDEAGRLRYLSPASNRLLGWDTDAVVGRLLDEFIHAHDQPALATALWSDEPSSQAIFRCLRHDGQLVWVEANFQRICDPDSGTVTEILGVLRNITERRAVDERLRESEQRFRGAFETAAHGMALISPEGRWLRVNEAICHMVGYSEAELLAIDFQTITHPDDLNADLAYVEAMLAGEINTYQMEKRYFHKNGQIVWILLSVSLVRSSNGEPRHFVSQIQNITDQKLAEDALRRSEAEFRLLADNSNDMIVRIGLDGVRRYASPASRLLLGFEPEELVGETPLSVIHPEDRDRVVTTCESLVTGAINPICAYRQLHQDGHYVWLEASFKLVRDEETGEPQEIIASVRDVSRRTEAELKAAEAAAHDRESHRLLVMAENIAHVGHWRVDSRTRAVYWSDEVFRIHGREIGDYPTLEEAIEAYHPDDRAMVHESIEQAMAAGIGYEYTARIVRPAGEIRHVQARAHIEKGRDGSIVGVFGAFLDMTELKTFEAELVAARDTAEAATHAKSDFLATMSHEIRTPMAGVLGMIELLRNAKPEEAAHLLDGLEQSAQMLTTILDDILDFSKIEGEHLTLEEVDFDLKALVEQTFRTFEMSSTNDQLTFSCHFAAEANPYVRGDPARLRQVIANLLSNAVKFTPTGRIELRVALPPADEHLGKWRVTVSDTGIGIDREMIGALFSPFVQADSSTTRKFGGTGLGLAICRRLIEAMGGEIGVTSEPEQGSLFWFAVPLARAPAPLLGEPPEQARPLTENPLSILLAEDNLINQTLIEGLLRRMGHRVSCVEHGRAAVAAVQADHFDLVLMDMQMPEMDGPDATAAIRALPLPAAQVPIVALTADASLRRRRLYEKAGIDGFLAKPIDSAKLASILDRFVSKLDALPTTETPAVTATGVLDRTRLELIGKTLGASQLDQLLVMLCDDIATRPEAIRTLVAAEDMQAARRSAHSLSGAALHLGATKLAQVARCFEHDETPLTTRVDELTHCAQETAAAIDLYRRELPAGAPLVAIPTA